MTRAHDVGIGLAVAWARRRRVPVSIGHRIQVCLYDQMKLTWQLSWLPPPDDTCVVCTGDVWRTTYRGPVVEPQPLLDHRVAFGIGIAQRGPWTAGDGRPLRGWARSVAVSRRGMQYTVHKYPDLVVIRPVVLGADDKAFTADLRRTRPLGACPDGSLIRFVNGSTARVEPARRWGRVVVAGVTHGPSLSSFSGHAPMRVAYGADVRVTLLS